MPYRKYHRKPKRGRRPPRRFKRKYNKKRVGSVLRPAVHRFKRVVQEISQLTTGEVPTNWTADGNAIYRQFVFTLIDLPAPTEFTNLFTAYRIKGVRIQAFFSNTQSVTENQNVMMTYSNNWNGQTIALTSDYFNQRQAVKRKLLLGRGGRAFDIYMPMRQLSNVWSGSAISNDYGTMKPKWIATTETGTPHYGINMRVERVDGQTFGTGTLVTNYAVLRLIHTYYLECRGVS